MKKDIPIKKVTNVAIAVVPNDEDPSFWDVYLINLKPNLIRTVLIVSRGYGEKDGEKVETNKLRYFYEAVGTDMAVKVELIDSKLFDLSHEYWLSFVEDDFMYDRKYVFVRGSFIEENMTDIPIVNKRGIWIK